MKRKLILLTSIVIVCGALVVYGNRKTSNVSLRDEDKDIAFPEISDPIHSIASIEPEKNIPHFPTLEQTTLIGRIVDGVTAFKAHRDDGGWWHCGELIREKERIDDHAVLIAFHAVHVSYSREINPWGLLGTIANESAFDPCALGLYPRKWAYSQGLIKRYNRGISHTKEEVLAVIESEEAKREFRKTGFDLGLCQILTKFYSGPPEDLLTVKKGLEICADEMKSRSLSRRTEKPWEFWHGHQSKKYGLKIMRLAKKIGRQPDLDGRI